ncbi:unnamed protein product [Symbiodinium pilosum]|uniref:Uncharacterized protein n=1 Tax=Symbiodinium pilosum TaxID=2952 RepID=A0A812PB88_SYMPI|nr:unnamed protein product [Symbiodinium pilosum]
MVRRSRRLWLGVLAAAMSLKYGMCDETASKAMVFRPWRPRASTDSPDSTTLPAVITLLVGGFLGMGAFQENPAVPQLFESVKDETWTGSRGRLARLAPRRSISLDAGRRFRDAPLRSRSRCRPRP